MPTCTAPRLPPPASTNAVLPGLMCGFLDAGAGFPSRFTIADARGLPAHAPLRIGNPPASGLTVPPGQNGRHALPWQPAAAAWVSEMQECEPFFQPMRDLSSMKAKI